MRKAKLSLQSFGMALFAVIATTIAISGLWESIPTLFHVLFKDKIVLSSTIASVLLFSIWILACVALLYMSYFVLAELFKNQED